MGLEPTIGVIPGYYLRPLTNQPLQVILHPDIHYNLNLCTFHMCASHCACVISLVQLQRIHVNSALHTSTLYVCLPQLGHFFVVLINGGYD